MMRVIEVTNLTKAYGPKAVVNDISFTVERGQVCGFLGPNGSGKTTTIGMLLGTVHPSSGDVRLFGTFNPGQFGGARHRLGAALETPSLHPHLSAEDNLRITATIKDTPRARIGAALELVKLTARRHDRVRTFSFGMKQRLALAAALLAEPELVVLDEPTNGLDPEGIHDLREIIRTLAGRGTTVFLSSHLLHEVEQLCTHVVVIHGGRVLRQGSLQALATPGGVTTLRAADLARLRDAVASTPARQPSTYTVTRSPPTSPTPTRRR